MRAYRNEVWDMFGNYFTEHTIRVVPSYENTMANSLAIAASNFKTPTAGQKNYKVDIVKRPSIPDNSKYWQVFEDDMQIKIFLELSGEFVNTQVKSENDNCENFQDVEGCEEESAEGRKLKNLLGGKDIVQLKSNYIPRGLIPLEKLFDQNDVARDPKMKPVDDVVEDRNIGTEENPQIIKLSKTCLSKKRKNISI